MSPSDHSDEICSCYCGWAERTLKWKKINENSTQREQQKPMKRNLYFVSFLMRRFSDEISPPPFLFVVAAQLPIIAVVVDSLRLVLSGVKPLSMGDFQNSFFFFTRVLNFFDALLTRSNSLNFHLSFYYIILFRSINQLFLVMCRYSD